MAEPARRYGRARRGQRAHGYVPLGRRQLVTMIGDLTLEGVGPVLTFEGATNSDRFETYVREGLLPILKPHDVVVMLAEGKDAHAGHWRPHAHGPPRSHARGARNRAATGSSGLVRLLRLPTSIAVITVAGEIRRAIHLR
ncbi:hypothetical protein [Corallococcus exiguus]|uniref:hypothetical protein n=1 Tax=Corallococcus exiguus TaxID=83462 RepID=UPI000ED7310F|nr:hypothetical protein [Corallococcus exiguus]NRD48179.1 hypothetical protein [Corallococcus exiguus]RKI00252.1 hypothetical protein D7Y04_17685 [Corallococcus sp. AB038B]